MVEDSLEAVELEDPIEMQLIDRIQQKERQMVLGEPVDRQDIGSEIESPAAYLGHWIELLKESPKVLFQVLSAARQAADFICPEPALPGPAELVGS